MQLFRSRSLPPALPSCAFDELEPRVLLSTLFGAELPDIADLENASNPIVRFETNVESADGFSHIDIELFVSEDGDPIDVLVCNTRVIVPGAVINCRPIGVLVMEDEAGNDEKVLAVPSSHVSRLYDGVTEYQDLPEIIRDQVQHFFQHYKDLEPDKWARIDHWGSSGEARSMITQAIERADTD